jgi:hypothetical protein
MCGLLQTAAAFTCKGIQSGHFAMLHAALQASCIPMVQSAVSQLGHLRTCCYTLFRLRQQALLHTSQGGCQVAARSYALSWQRAPRQLAHLLYGVATTGCTFILPAMHPLHIYGLRAWDPVVLSWCIEGKRTRWPYPFSVFLSLEGNLTCQPQKELHDWATHDMLFLRVSCGRHLRRSRSVAGSEGDELSLKPVRPPLMSKRMHAAAGISSALTAGTIRTLQT